MAQNQRGLWGIVTPTEIGDQLVRRYLGSAWIEALWRFRRAAAESNEDPEFWRAVLSYLEADNLVDFDLTPRVVAESFNHNVVNALEDIGDRLDHAYETRDRPAWDFWKAALDDLIRLRASVLTASQGPSSTP